MSETRRVTALTSLPPPIRMQCLSFLTYDSRRLASFAALCRSMQAALDEDSAWALLCKQHWYATDERLREWPTLSARGLYSALEMWVPLEGYYVLATAFPWGLLVLLRITGGRVVADVIRFVPEGDAFQEVHLPLFRLDFQERRRGTVHASIVPSWRDGSPAALGSQEEVTIAALDPSDLRGRRDIAGADTFGHRSTSAVGVFNTHRALRLSVSPAAGTPPQGPAPSPQALLPGELPGTADEASSRTQAMLSEMMSGEGAACDLALVRSPSEFVLHDPTFPGIRPGLYVGDYGHDFYGQYRTEVLLVEYITLSPRELEREAGQPTRVFSRPEGVDSNPPAEALRKMLALGEDVTFVRGVKQCGDLHVPMGATTFVAVCGPPEACRLLQADRGDPVCSVRNRATSGREEVVRSWCGFGTLSMPGFVRPSWAKGVLAQLPDASGDGSHRFAFSWDRNQEAVVLNWIRAQDASPFLQRTWLPSELR